MCDDARVAEYVDGMLAADSEAAFVDHLLSCTACAQAVAEDRRGRQMVAALRLPLGEGVRERLAAAVQGAASPTSVQRGRSMMFAAAVLAVVVVIAAIASMGLTGGRGEVSVVSPTEVMSQLLSSDPVAGVAPEVRTEVVGGVAVVIASRAAPFAMPAGSRRAEGGAIDAWVATRGGVNVVCLNGDRPLLVASALAPQVILDALAERGLL